MGGIANEILWRGLPFTEACHATLASSAAVTPLLGNAAPPRPTSGGHRGSGYRGERLTAPSRQPADASLVNVNSHLSPRYLLCKQNSQTIKTTP